ncbi:hypothetical protein FQZ97_926880 [compost metagenome]
MNTTTALVEYLGILDTNQPGVEVIYAVPDFVPNDEGIDFMIFQNGPVQLWPPKAAGPQMRGTDRHCQRYQCSLLPFRFIRSSIAADQ